MIPLGPLLALSAAALWAVSPMFMASAGRRVGSFPVVLLRSLLASFMLGSAILAVALITGVAPALPGPEQAAWLVLSGLIGMGIGDVLIYEAFVTLGPRRTTQALVIAPAVTVVLGWLTIGEALSAQTLVGIAVILAATFYAVVIGRRRPIAPKPVEEVIAAGESGDVESIDEDPPETATKSASPAAAHIGEPGHVTATGVLFAVGGAVCMAVGAVTGRIAFSDEFGPVDTACATWVRVASAGVFLWLAPVVRRQVPKTLSLLRDRHVLSRVAAGTVLGPFVGMFCYMGALKASPAGLVSTLVATSPLFAIPITMLRYRARIGWDVCLAALVAVAGVGLLFFR